MAITGAQLQTALGDGDNNVPIVLREFGIQGTLQGWLIKGGSTYPGRTKMIDTTAADTAEAQATSVRTALVNGPA